jgi:VWFA-related protein
MTFSGVMAGLGIWAVFGSLAIAAGLQTPDPRPARFHAGTRLVEVEVVVRDKHGPVAGLTHDDFTLLDQGKPQRIDVFRAGQADTKTRPVPLAPGEVSNRLNGLGESLPSATVLLFDQLNTRFDYKAYESKAILKLIRSLGQRDRVAIYALGKNLHVLQEFTDDPEKLLAALAHLDSGRDLLPANVADALFDFPVDMTGQIDAGSRLQDARSAAMNKGSIEGLAELTAQVYAANNDYTTVEALQRIVEHLGGMPGRRNLIWVKEEPIVPPAVMGMLLQANIALYPVLIRTVEYGAPDFMATQHAAHDLAAPTGGAGFDDAGDLQIALRTAEEDSRSAYTLGYYPSEDVLDGKYHRLTVTVAKERTAHLEVRYRPGYLATKQAIATLVPPQADAIAELLQNPLDTTAIGLTAQFTHDGRSGLYRLRVTVDLHDVHLEREGGRSVGKLELGYSLGGEVRGRTIEINLTDAALAEALASGFAVSIADIPASGGSLRVVARDPSTGLAGSVTVPAK